MKALYGLSILLLLISACITSEAATPHKFAVLIGIGDYPEASGLAKLKADLDTDKLADHLKQAGWTVYLMNSHSAMANQPNRANLLRAFGIEQKQDGGYKYLKSNSVAFLGSNVLTDADTLLFYYGGHGTSLTDGVNYIIPKDVQDTTSESQLISLEVIKNALDLTGAGNIIELTDACRTRVDRGPSSLAHPWRGASASIAGGRAFELDFKQRHFYEIRASRLGSPSYEKEDAGVFTSFLNTAFDSPETAKSGSGRCVSLHEWGQYTVEQTQIYARTRLSAKQEPTVQSDGTGWEDKFCMIPLATEAKPVETADDDAPVLLPSKPDIETFEADTETIRAGQPVVLTWSVKGANRIVISGVGPVGPIGTKTVRPTADTKYMLLASGSSGKTEQTIEVMVEDDAVSCNIVSWPVGWYPPGRAAIQVDGTGIGTFDFGPNGNTQLPFTCQVGQHSWHLEFMDATGGRGACDGGIIVTASVHDFIPSMVGNGQGMLRCDLRPR